jgi:hypothetical protein
MATMTPKNLRDVRAEVGSTPSDDDLQDLWDALAGSIPAVALAVLRPRLADALNARSVTIPGVIGVGAPPAPTVLAAQISRLEAQLAAESGDVDTSGLTATSILVGRIDRAR